MQATIVTLGEQEYKVPALNIDQLERVSDIIEAASTNKSGRVSFAVLRIALERADPKPEDASQIEATASQIGAAFRDIMKTAGLIDGAAGSQPGEAPPAGG